MYKIFRLHEQLKMGVEVLKELDRYIYVWAMIKNNHPVLTESNIDHFIIQKKDVFGALHLPEIGADIRAIFFEKSPKTLMMYLIDYSLPYIKHNRLTLPQLNCISYTDLIGFTKIMLGTLLGVFEHCKRRPTWEIRVFIVSFFHEMYTCNSSESIYNFCLNNLALLRISVIEYFLYFLKKNMPVELKCNELMFESGVAMRFVFDNILFTLDNFRQSCLQKTFSWKEVNSNAALCVERLNRVCKGKMKKNYRRQVHEKQNQYKIVNLCRKYGMNTVINAFKLPRFSHVQYIDKRFLEKDWSSLEFLHDTKVLSECVDVHVLPGNIKREQIEAYRNYLTIRGPFSIEPCTLYFCLRCNSVKQNQHNFKVRCQSGDVVTCEFCKKSNFIISINMIGRIARVFDQYFYFCKKCCAVHLWKYNGMDLMQCQVKTSYTKQQTQKNCCLCRKQYSEIINVLDDSIGIMHSVRLCRWHYPEEHLHSCIHNIDTLWSLVKSKVSTKRGRHW